MNHASSSTTFLVLDKLKISKERIGFVNFVVLNTINILKCDFIVVLQRHFLVCYRDNLLERDLNPLWMLQYWISHFIYIPTNYPVTLGISHKNHCFPGILVQLCNPTPRLYFISISNLQSPSPSLEYYSFLLAAS